MPETEIALPESLTSPLLRTFPLIATWLPDICTPLPQDDAESERIVEPDKDGAAGRAVVGGTVVLVEVVVEVDVAGRVVVVVVVVLVDVVGAAVVVGSSDFVGAAVISGAALEVVGAAVVVVGSFVAVVGSTISHVFAAPGVPNSPSEP